MKQLLLTAFEDDTYISLMERPTNSHLPDYIIHGNGWDYGVDLLRIQPTLSFVKTIPDREYAVAVYLKLLSQLTDRIITA